MQVRGMVADRRWFVAAAVVLGTALAAGVVLLAGDGANHDWPTGLAGAYDDELPAVPDPDGPLMHGVSGRVAVGWTGMLAQYDPEAPTLTFSFPVCLTGPGPVTIIDLQPLQVIGTDVELIGTLLHGLPLSTTGTKTLTGSQQGFPPANLDPDSVQPLAGAEVTVPCGLPAARVQEVLFGLQATGADGGGWRGAVLTYSTAEGKNHRLVVPQESLLCGRSNEPCADAEA